MKPSPKDLRMPKPKDNLAYVYTRKPKRGEKVRNTVALSNGVYLDRDKQGFVQGVEFLKVYEIWVNGEVIWKSK